MKRIILSLTLCSIGYLGFGQVLPTPCTGVSADFLPLPDLPAGGIKFNNETQVTGTQSVTYQWNFGNGASSEDLHPFCMYDEGTYTVVLTVNGDNGCQTVVEKEVEFTYGGY